MTDPKSEADALRVLANQMRLRLVLRSCIANHEWSAVADEIEAIAALPRPAQAESGEAREADEPMATAHPLYALTERVPLSRSRRHFKFIERGSIAIRCVPRSEGSPGGYSHGLTICADRAKGDFDGYALVSPEWLAQTLAALTRPAHAESGEAREDCDYDGEELRLTADGQLECPKCGAGLILACRSAAPKPAQGTQAVCNRNCDCVGECKAGIESRPAPARGVEDAS